MRKFYIKDEDGSELEVTEVDEEPVEEVKKDEEPTEVIDEELALSAEEIAAIKKLAPVADKILALLEQEVTEEGHDLSDEDEVVEDSEEEKKEEVVDTEEEKKEMKKDSKSSFGSIMKKTTSKDSLDDREEDIAKAWSKRALNNK